MEKFFQHHLKQSICIAFLWLLIAAPLNVSAQSKAPLRRVISPEQPMWLIHIDTWNWADPQKIIDMVPEDIRPYIVFNISLSINHDANTGKWLTVEYGYETAKSWLRTCAENRVWAMIQPSSGGFSHFTDFDVSVYEEFFRNYPNFLGFNYCEQFWGFDDPYSVTFPERLAHWTNLMKLNQKYGGYLVVSFCGMFWGASLNPVAMMKRDANFAAICRQNPEHFILCEKFTSRMGFFDVESTCLGTYLSGFSGQYGIRFDECGWNGINGEDKFPVPAGAIPVVEHVMLTGQTVIDGPETIPQQSSREISSTQTPDGYTTRRWEFYPQFHNISIDIFRKILDGTIRILSRKEVIDRTKAVIINDVNTGDDRDKYSSPETLFEGLYRMDDDGNWMNNLSWFKKTGRYPAIPTVYQLSDADANSFPVQVNKSAYTRRWPNIQTKINEFNNLFPQEYTGDLYAGRSENGWVTYNPYKTGQAASATIPFQYNSCDSLKLNYSKYSLGVIKEYAGKLTFYLTNYNNDDTALKTDVIKIYGSSSEPAFSYQDRANHQASAVTKNWADGVFTLTVTHNGALDITVNCSGQATDRLTSYKTAVVVAPEKPAVYTGPRQYEAENFDYKNITKNQTNGINSGTGNYTAQGYLNFGSNASACVRDTVYALRKGVYRLRTRYRAPRATVKTIDLYINGNKIASPEFTKTENKNDVWEVNTQYISLNTGKNSIEFRANKASYDFYLDNIVIDEESKSGVYDFTNDEATSSATTPAAELVTVQSGTAGVIAYTAANNETSNGFRTYSAGTNNGTGVADLDMFSHSAVNYSVVWKEYYDIPGGQKGILLRGNGASQYAGGMKQGYLFIVQNNANNTVTLKPYIVDANGLNEKPAYTSDFKILPGQACWYRVTASGNRFIFECSGDSVNWIGESITTFTDDACIAGSTQLVWGLNASNFNWIMDDISFLPESNLIASQTSLKNFRYNKDAGPSGVQTFDLYGSSLTGRVTVQAPENYEISLNPDREYASSLEFDPERGELPPNTIYVRLKEGLPVKVYDGELSITSGGIPAGRIFNLSIGLDGSVLPAPVSLLYDFTNDVASSSAATPPALNMTIGSGNSATAGVVSYTDASGVTGNMLKPYGTGQRNATGVIDMNLFPKDATDYSVTWKQCLGSGSNDYKIGVLLRGDASGTGDATTGYVQGIMTGYLFNVYVSRANNRSEFRIYRSTSSASLYTLRSTAVNGLNPAAGQAVWYRASVSGNDPVSLTFEYSTNGGVTWNTGASVTETTALNTSGATQLVWGLAVTNTDFYLDDIGFYGISGNGTSIPVISKNIPAVVSKEYYDLMGRQIHPNSLTTGIYIVRQRMSDGSVNSRKIIHKR